jgi:hypothetical protein
MLRKVIVALPLEGHPIKPIWDKSSSGYCEIYGLPVISVNAILSVISHETSEINTGYPIIPSARTLRE